MRTAVYVRALSAELKAEDALLPDGLDINRALWALDPPERPRRYVLWQRGETLVVEPAEAAARAVGSPVARLRAAAPVVQLRADAEPGAAEGPWRSLPLDGAEGAAVVPLPEAGAIGLKTDHDTLRIEPMIRPDWATALGRDRAGLFVVVGEGEAERRVYWLDPGTCAARAVAGSAAAVTCARPSAPTAPPASATPSSASASPEVHPARG